ncbi:tetratricopeptide repeat protein [Nannocystis sp. SCPEA4]|uniref:tetratricopeptide repeat protein n=1 Tax=Nannocystis sp. SCPEA4 TaxID=2996787 RepID=UPI00226DD217|nr:tetratricopeptide repeat protein [Nannocystis sp. SCPEA4]MCY1061587.1 tetratricopeptide repeat protein [Nannocystis sp. SCPEA4]
MIRAWAGAVAVMIVGCTGGSPNSNPGNPTAPTKAAPVVTDVPSKTAPVTPPPAVANAGAGEDWLVWWFHGDTWRTRWLRVDGEAASVVGEREALIVGDAARLWQIERADTEVAVKSCQCEHDDLKRCPDAGKVTMLGLRARELGGDSTVTIHEARAEPLQGEDMEFGLQVVGGAQARLIVESSDSGYFCGAHGSYSVVDTVFDVAAGRKLELQPDWWKQLPEPIRRAAVQSIEKEYNGCHGTALSTNELMNEHAYFAGAALTLVRGAPTITWKLAVSAMYVCSSDYAYTGQSTSGLVAEAAPLGLAGPLPAGVTAALASIGDAKSLGFSRLTLPDRERAARLAAFTAASERPWPELGSRARSMGGSAGQAKVDEGRKKTREKNYAEAIAAFDAAIEIDAELVSAYAGRGYAHLLAGDRERARADFKTALRKSDEPKLQAAVWFNMGTLAVQENDTKAARAAFEKSQAMRPSKQAEAALAGLDAPGK